MSQSQNSIGAKIPEVLRCYSESAFASFLATAECSSQPRGLRRRGPRTANFYVTEALNSLLADYGLSQFCVPEAEPASGRVRRFVVRAD